MDRKILIVEDEYSINEILTIALKKEGYEVRSTFDGKSALIEIEKFYPEMILLDVMLPDYDGFDICKQISDKYLVIMITAKDSIFDKIVGLELGADDYITKPFEIKEVMARGKGKINQAYESFNVKKMISEMTNELELTLEKDKIHIEVCIKDMQLYAIKDEVRTIFKNLIENAIKYSKDKRICIENVDEKAFMIIIKNRCLPIPKNLREHLLEPFVKYNFGDVEKVNSGLGLFICKELIEKYNGEITYRIDDDEICFIIEFMNQESQKANKYIRIKK